MHIEVIDQGESLFSIAKRYGVTVEDIVRVNGMDEGDQLVIGQTILVPTRDRTHTVRPGESLWSIARRYHVSVQEIAQLNGISTSSAVSAGTVLRIPRAQKRTIEVNGYLQPSGTERDARLVASVDDAMTYFTIFSYHADEEGNLNPVEDDRALAAIRDTDAVPMMGVTNIKNDAFSADVTRAIFGSTAIREKLVTNILSTMREKGYFALNIDFEHVRPEDRQDYLNFLRELVTRVKRQGQGHLVSVALAPKISATQAGQWYEAHDYPGIGSIVDFVVIMTYEWGWSGGPPMAVAPVSQVRRVLDYAVTAIPRHKIMMGAPLYGYDWTLPYVKGGKYAKALGIQEALDLARRVNARIHFDHSAQAPFFRYYDADGKEHVVWFEDARSSDAKFKLIREYDLRGISYWALGKPFPQNWPLLLDRFTVRRYKS
jgi:spore germination protein